MGLLSLSNLAMYIKKAEFSGIKALKMISKMRWHPKFNLGQLKLMFAIKLSMEKQIKKNLAAWFSDLPAINATVFRKPEITRKS
jgi:hypothetical protein